MSGATGLCDTSKGAALPLVVPKFCHALSQPAIKATHLSLWSLQGTYVHMSGMVTVLMLGSRHSPECSANNSKSSNTQTLRPMVHILIYILTFKTPCKILAPLAVLYPANSQGGGLRFQEMGGLTDLY